MVSNGNENQSQYVIQNPGFHNRISANFELRLQRDPPESGLFAFVLLSTSRQLGSGADSELKRFLRLVGCIV